MKKNKYLEYLEDGTFAIRYGWINKYALAQIDDTDTITFNIYLTLTTFLVHEVLHHDYPRKTEDEIRDMEERQVNRMKREEIIEIGKKLLRHLLMSPVLDDV